LGPDGLLLIYDELAIPWRALRIRPKGSAAGHRGVSSVIASTGTQEFARLRLGIAPDHERDAKEFVLRPIARTRMAELDEFVDAAASAAEAIITEGVEKAMTAHNRHAPGAKQEET
jgi:PTH1 family peptidyl-tRNA hydrolase